VANKTDYISRIQVAVMHLHNCSATWSKSVYVEEVFRGEVAWSGEVEVFDLTGHPKAKRCYGWTYGEPEEFITILELSPVTDAHTAVKVGISYQIKKGRLK
jgi:hypothetical protein